MVVAETMSKSVVKVLVDSDTSSAEEDSSDGENLKEALVVNAKVDKGNTGGEADDSTESDSNNATQEAGNEGWADSLAKILGSNKPKNKKTLVLSRAKKHSDVLKSSSEKKSDFEVIGEKEVETLSDPAASTEPVAKKKKLDKPSIKVKPDILEKGRERLLSKIATKGVVQLFNAVRNQQKTIEKETDRKDITETKKEKILKKFDKRTFLDTLMGNTKSINVDDQAKVKKDEEQPKWKVLRDDYMMSAKVKDWDKDPDED